jgi:hypothetical protein
MSNASVLALRTNKNKDGIMASTARVWIVREKYRLNGKEFIAVLEDSEGAQPLLIALIGGDARITPSQRLSDAQLISAAPEMFSALSELNATKLLKSGGVGQRRSKAVVSALRALGKARGS